MAIEKTYTRSAALLKTAEFALIQADNALKSYRDTVPMENLSEDERSLLKILARKQKVLRDRLYAIESKRLASGGTPEKENEKRGVAAQGQSR